MTNSPYTTDTSPEAAAMQLECIRAMSPQQRMSQVMALSYELKRMAEQAIRRRHPTASDNEVQLLFIEQTYGVKLANEVRRWKEERNK